MKKIIKLSLALSIIAFVACTFVFVAKPMAQPTWKKVSPSTSSSGGGGSTINNSISARNCYYTTGSCGEGFTDMAGSYNNGVAHNVCCSGGAAAIPDVIPGAFDVPSVSRARNETFYDDIRQVAGITSTDISITGTGTPEYRLCADASCSNVTNNWSSATRTIYNGQYFQVRSTAPATNTATVTATIEIGEFSDDWTVTAQDYLAFVTSTTHNGNLGGIVGADAICATRASSAGLSGTYRAWLSETTANEPLDRFENVGTNDAFLLVGSLDKIADDWSDLTNSSLDHALDRDENGSLVSGAQFAWTSTQGNGTNYGNTSHDCVNWSNGTSGNGYGGNTSATNSQWTLYSYKICSESHRIYCFQTTN